MTLRKRTDIIGRHAFLSPSSYSWLDYDEEKLRRVYFTRQQSVRGDQLHEFAQRAINLGIRQAENGTTLSTYINDAIGFRLTPEVPLYYSDDCFGTADACGFRQERWENKLVDTLRISDLKTGLTPGDMRQLLIYVGLFCLDFKIDPTKIRTILRIYQNDTVEEMFPDPADIQLVISRIKYMSALVAQFREED